MVSSLNGGHCMNTELSLKLYLPKSQAYTAANFCSGHWLQAHPLDVKASQYLIHPFTQPMSTEPLAPSMAGDTTAPKIGLSYEWLTRKVTCTITMCWEQVNCAVLMSLLIWRNSETPTDGREVQGSKKYFSIITNYLVAIPAHHPSTKTIKPKIHTEIISPIT